MSLCALACLVLMHMLRSQALSISQCLQGAPHCMHASVANKALLLCCLLWVRRADARAA